MKKIIVAVILMTILLVSCAGNGGEGTSSANSTDSVATSEVVSEVTGTEEGENTGKSLRDLVPEAIKAGNFGDSMSLIYNDDEYADDVLEFAYGVEADLAAKIEAYVLSEQSGMSAYSFAYFKFTDDATSDDIEKVKTAVNEVYVAGLKSSLEAYNPEAYAMCSNAIFKEINGDLAFVICDAGDSDKVFAELGA